MSAQSSGRAPRHVVVAGAGIVGLSTAWFLQERGVEVTVIDGVGVAGGSSWGNAGWLAPALTTPLPEPAVLAYGLKAVLSPSSPVYVPLRFDAGLIRFLAGFARNSTPRRCEAIRVSPSFLPGSSGAMAQRPACPIGLWILPPHRSSDPLWSRCQRRTRLRFTLVSWIQRCRCSPSRSRRPNANRSCRVTRRSRTQETTPPPTRGWKARGTSSPPSSSCRCLRRSSGRRN